MATDIDTERAVADLRELNILTLAKLADCAAPDAPDSVGAKFLSSVRSAVVDAIEYGGIDRDHEALNDAVHEIADDAPSVLTHTLWQEFVELCAYSEEPDYGLVGGCGIGKLAALHLYTIAERLAIKLFEMAAETASETGGDNL